LHWNLRLSRLIRRSSYSYSALVFLFGSAVLLTLGYIYQLLGAELATAALSLLIVIVLLSTLGTYVTSVLLSFVAAGCLSYFFSPPLYSLRVERLEDIVALCAFLTSSIVITGLAAKIRNTSEGELQQTRAELARFARVAVLGELAASIAHEVNQPLAGVVSSANACRRWLTSQPPNIERASQSVERLIRDADRARDVIERVRGLIINNPPDKAAVIVNEVLQEVILLTRREVALNQIKLEAELPEGLPLVSADRIQLQQVCLNLIMNAIESFKTVNDGRRNLLLKAEKDASGNVLFTVSDTGSGLGTEDTEEIFNAFYTTKPEGIGMGLKISRSIIEAHGGLLWASDNIPRGTKFQFTLPPHREDTRMT
jgi:C4-dicarboxylate-specific signal transduction histidine kinase